MAGVRHPEIEQAIAEGDVVRAAALCHATAANPAADPETLAGHAALLNRWHRAAEAAALWNRLLVHPQATSAHWLGAARQLFARHDFHGCARFTERARAADPSDADTAVLHASALERAGELAIAGEIVTATLARHPANPRAARLLAHIHHRQGRSGEARRLLESHLAAHPSGDDWRLRYELAAVLDRSSEPDAAMEQLLLAKRQLAPAAASHRTAAEAMAGRQWELTRALTPQRLGAWSDVTFPQTTRLCLMAGFARSGTTLMERIVTTHPDCVGTDESGILASQFRDPIVFGATSAGEALEELDAFQGDDLEAGRAEYLRATGDWIGEPVGDRLLVEKEPLLTADLAIPLRLFPEATILMPIRDPRDVVISYFFTIVPLAPHSVAALTLQDTVRAYCDVMRHWLLLRDRLCPARWCECRYEDLLARPEQETRRLAAFLGLDWTPAMLAHHQREPDARAVGTPTYHDVSQPLYTRSVARWRHYERWLEPHLKPLEPYLEAFGYV